MSVAVALGASGASAQQAPVTDYADLDSRLQRLERLLESQSLVRLLESVEALQKEIRTLRGEFELQGHGVSQLKQRQRELYLDVDRRLQRMEVAGVPVAGAAPGAQPAPGTAARLPSSARTGALASVAAAGGAPAASGQEARRPAVPAGAPGATGSTVTAAAGAAPAGTAPATGVPSPGAAGAVQNPQMAAATPVVDPFQEQQAYQAAFNLLKAGRYEPAVKSFQEFLAGNPQSKYADNAQYWLGETYYVTRKFDAALQEFQTLVGTYPTSQKLTHALLKIGYIHGELGQSEEAQRVLGDLVTRYPNTTAAGLARKRLQRLRASQ